MAVALMSKIVKQRKESIKSYADAGRQDLATSEQEELGEPVATKAHRGSKEPE